MPRSLADLPFDVLSEIWEYLAGDHCALRASALTCKAVLPLSQRRLFATVNFAKLSNADFISAFGDYVTELRCVGSRLGIEEEAGLDRQRLLSAALELTRLRALELRCVGLFELEEPLPDFRYLSTARFISVTTLTLRGTVHTKLAEAKRLINSLAALAYLSLADMNIRTSVYFGIPGFGNPPAIVDENEFDEDADRAGPRLVSLRVECRRSLTHGATALVRWLARTPTAHTLRRLDLSWEGIRGALVPLATFGPAVDDLAFSLDDLAGCRRAWLRGYTGTRTLRVREVLSDEDWILLASLLAKVPPRHLRLLELHYAHATITPLPSPDVLARVSDRVCRRFPLLARVRIVVRWVSVALDRTWDAARARARVDARFRENMREVAKAGKLEVLFPS